MANPSCPVCSSTQVWPSTQRRPWDLTLALFLPIEPMTCQTCHHRFYARSSKIGSAYRVFTWLALGLIVAWTIFLNVRYWELDRDVARILNLPISGVTGAADSPQTAGNRLTDESRMEIRELLDSLTQAQDELSEVRERFLEADRANGELLLARADMEIEMAKLGARNRELEEEILNLKTANVAPTSTLSGGGQDQSDVTRELESVKTENANLAGELAAVTEKYQQTMAALTENEARLSKSEQDLAALQQTLSESQSAWTGELESVKSESVTLARELAEMTVKYEKANAALEANAAQLSTSQRDLAALRQTLADQEPALTRLAAAESTNADIEQELAALHSDNLKLKEELRVISDKNASIEAEFSRKVAELVAANQRMRELEQTIASQESVTGDSEREISRLKAGNDELRQQLASALGARDDATSTLSTTNRHLAESERLVSELNSGNESLRAKLETLRATNADLTGKLAAVADEKTTLTARSKDLTEQLSIATRTIAELEQTGADDRSAAQETERALSSLAAENLELKAELESVTGQNAQLEGWLIEKTTALAKATAQPPVETEAETPDIAAADSREARVQEIMDMLEDWREAWSGQRLDDYLSHYSGDFQPADGLNQQTWRLIRTERLSQPEFIRLQVEDVRVLPAPADRFQVQFIQRYESDTYADTVEKILELVREAGEWKIVAERAGTG